MPKPVKYYIQFGERINTSRFLHKFDDDDNLKVTTDFRAVYASLLEQWLGTGANEVLPDAGRVGRVTLVA